jgi:hypothetical protein
MLQLKPPILTPLGLSPQCGNQEIPIRAISSFCSNEPSTETKSLQGNKSQDSTIQGTQRLAILNKEIQPTAYRPHKAMNG